MKTPALTQLLLHWFLLTLVLPAITPEVAKVYRPVSYRETVSFSERGEEAYQAGVLSFPTVVSGAIPEDLIASVQQPTQLNVIADIYEVEEVNLLALCQINLGVSVESESALHVTLSLRDFALPEDLELGARTVLELTKSAIKRTLVSYYEEAKSYQEVTFHLEGLTEAQETLRSLEETFTIGEKQPVLEEEMEEE